MALTNGTYMIQSYQMPTTCFSYGGSDVCQGCNCQNVAWDIFQNPSSGNWTVLSNNHGSINPPGGYWSIEPTGEPHVYLMRNAGDPNSVLTLVNGTGVHLLSYNASDAQQLWIVQPVAG